MKMPFLISIFCVRRSFKMFSALHARQGYDSDLLQAIHKVGLIRFYGASTSEWHKTIDLNFLIMSKIITGIEKDRLQKIVDELKFVSRVKNGFPDFISSEQLQELYETETRSQRQNFLRFLSRKEQLKLSEVKRKERKKAERETKLEEKKDDSSPIYGRNTLVPIVRFSSVKKFYCKRLANAALFGRKIAIDLNYDQYMITREKKTCVAQLKILFSLNRKNIDPFDLYFCNANPDSTCVQYLNRDVPNISDSFVSVTKQSYLDIFPKDNLVYLSPHAKKTLKEYDPNAVYIIGAFVDTVQKKHFSLHKAESEGIKSYSLPLDEYIMWGAGTKCLTINQVFEIMLTLKNTGDWIKSFECIPTRKIRKLDTLQIENQDLTNKIYVTSI